MLTQQQRRPSRVPFKHPVRIETIDEPIRIIRTLASNVSSDGIFLRMPQPLTEGTRVLVSLEAGGAPRELAEGEVRWGTTAGDAGCGVLFTRYSHPRSKELLVHLVDTIEHNRATRVAGRPKKWRRLIVVAVALFGLAVPLALPGDPGEEPATPAVQISQVDQTPPQQAPEVPEVQEVAVAEPVVEAPLPVEPMPEAPVKKSRVLTSARARAKQVPSLEEALQGAPPPTRVTPAPHTDFGARLSLAGSTKGQFKLPSGAASALTWDVSPNALRFSPSGKVTKAFVLSNPARVVFHVEGNRPVKAESLGVPAPHVKALRVDELPKGTRLVIELDRAPRDSQKSGDALLLTF